MRLELLALKYTLTEKFRDYCLGSKIVAYTDNNPLSRIKECKLSATDMRWVAQIEQFNIVIKFKPGRANGNADSLSRKERVEGSIRDQGGLVAVGTIDADNSFNIGQL